MLTYTHTQVEEVPFSEIASQILMQTGTCVSSYYLGQREHTSAYVSIRQHTSAYVIVLWDIGRHRIRHYIINLCPYVSIRQHTSAYVSTRQHTSAYVTISYCHKCVRILVYMCVTLVCDRESIRQHTSAYVSIRQQS